MQMGINWKQIFSKQKSSNYFDFLPAEHCPDTLCE